MVSCVVFLKAAILGFDAGWDRVFSLVKVSRLSKAVNLLARHCCRSSVFRRKRLRTLWTGVECRWARVVTDCNSPVDFSMCGGKKCPFSIDVYLCGVPAKKNVGMVVMVGPTDYTS